MKRKWTALLLCLLLVVQMAGLPANAAGDVYFIGAEENILSLSDSTMPFWQDNYLYIPSTMFVGTTRDSLKIGSSQSSDGSWVALYWGNRALLFKKDLPYGEDQDGRRYYPGTVERNGILFVPAGVVTDFFGLRYSIQKVANGSLVWLRSKDFILTEEVFGDAATSAMNQRYAEYLSAKNQAAASQPDKAEDPEEPVVSGKRLYLCARAGENTAAVLDLLDRYGGYMTFFCTPEFMEENDDLLRRITGTGHGIGILAEAGEDASAVSEQLRRANLALEQATGTMTRLVRVENAEAETVGELLMEGYCPTATTLEVSQYTLRSGKQAEQLFRSMTTSRGAAVAWLGEEISLGGLGTFLSRAGQAEDPCMPLTETVQIP